MRAMADIQAEGLRAAGELLERMLGSEPEAAATRGASAGGRLRRAGRRVDRPGAAHGRRTRCSRAGPARRHRGRRRERRRAAGAPGARRVERTAPSAATEVWLHNGTLRRGRARWSCAAGSSATPTARCSKGPRCGFEPGEVEPLPARSSRAVTVSLDADGRAASRHLPRHDPGARGAGALAAAGGRDRAVLTADGTDLVEAYSEDVSRLVRRSMLDAIPDGEPHRWLYRVARAYPSRPGKAIRPALCVATSRAFGGRDEDILPVAVAIELLHNAFLVHDDIVDGSERRRGRPTLPAEYGLGLALNAGDALAVLVQPGPAASRELHGRRPGRRPAVRVRRHGAAHARGPGHRARLAPRPRGGARARGLPRPDHAQDVLVHDRAPACGSARWSAPRGAADLRPMVRFGFYLGAAFQIQDDLLNLLGTEREYGKEIDGDLYEGKRTLPLIHLVRNAQRPRSRRARSLPQPRALGAHRRRWSREVRDLLDAYGSIDVRGGVRARHRGSRARRLRDGVRAGHGRARPRLRRALVPYMLDRRT